MRLEGALGLVGVTSLKVLTSALLGGSICSNQKEATSQALGS